MSGRTSVRLETTFKHMSDNQIVDEGAVFKKARSLRPPTLDGCVAVARHGRPDRLVRLRLIDGFSAAPFLTSPTIPMRDGPLVATTSRPGQMQHRPGVVASRVLLPCRKTGWNVASAAAKHNAEDAAASVGQRQSDQTRATATRALIIPAKEDTTVAVWPERIVAVGHDPSCWRACSWSAASSPRRPTKPRFRTGPMRSIAGSTGSGHE